VDFALIVRQIISSRHRATRHADIGLLPLYHFPRSAFSRICADLREYDGEIRYAQIHADILHKTLEEIPPFVRMIFRLPLRVILALHEEQAFNPPHGGGSLCTHEKPPVE